MTPRRSLRLAPILLAVFVLTGCIDEIGSLFEILAFEESDDPKVQETGRAIREAQEEREVREALDQFAATGDPRFLEDARALRPDDTAVRAYDVVLAMQSGDPAAVEAAKEALALAEARRLQQIDDSLEGLTGQPQPATTAEMLRRNVLGEILVAQTKLLGGSLTRSWEPPPPDAPPERLALYEDYCSTRAEIMGPPFHDSLSYIPLPPCSSA